MNEPVRQQEAGGSNATLWIAFALLLAGVAGYYVLESQPIWLRWLCVVAGLVAGALVFGLSAGGRGFKQFVVDARNELRKVFWPTRNETLISTVMVLAMVALASIFFLLADSFIAWIVQWVLKIR